MKHQLVVEIDVSNPRWIPRYFRHVIPLAAKYGGRYITRTSSVTVLEGDAEAPQHVVVAEFPSKEAALGFFNCEEYKPFKEARQAGSTSKILLIAIENGT